jgi:hypothetical protein
MNLAKNHICEEIQQHNMSRWDKNDRWDLSGETGTFGKTVSE